MRKGGFTGHEGSDLSGASTNGINISIVFSSWVRSLELAQAALHSQGVGCRIIDGRLKIDERKRILETFRKEPQVIVLLMTTGTGAAGYDPLSWRSTIRRILLIYPL